MKPTTRHAMPSTFSFPPFLSLTARQMPSRRHNRRNPAEVSMKWLHSLSVVLIMSLTLIACGSGGGRGEGLPPDGAPPPAATQTIVSGTVQAPNGQVAFHQPTLWDLFESSAYASLSGLTPVPDGTPVQLGHIDRNGHFVDVVASTTVSGGRYSFNLTNLGLTFSSTLVVSASNPASGVRMRAFVTRETVNLDPISESTVQLVVDRTARMLASDQSHFTPQELNDLQFAIDALTAANQTGTGAGIDVTVAAIKTLAANEPHIVTFLAAADAPGQTQEGPGDIGNFLPLDRPGTYEFQGTEQVTGQPPVSYSNTAAIAGTASVNGVLTTVLSQTNPLNTGIPIESYYTEDGRGLTLHGDNDQSDVLTPQLVPSLVHRVPFGTGLRFEDINRKGLNFGQDLDGDGKSETIDILSIKTVLGFEEVSVPAGSFPNCAKIETKRTLTLVASSNGATESLLVTETTWYAAGIGPVKGILKFDDDTLTEELQAFSQQNARMINLTTNDLVFDPATQQIYASVPGNPGSVTPIDPVTGTLGQPIPVGNGPTKLARSDNGQLLYVGLDGEGAVQRIDLATQTAELKFSLGSDPFFGPYFVEDMEVLPDSPQSVAVSRKYKTVSPRHAGVAIYDNGVQRPTTTPGHTGSNVIEFSASASRLYGYNNETTEFGFRRMTVDASGVTVLDAFTSFMGDLISGIVDIKFDGGRLYTTSGRVIDPETRTVVGTFPGAAGVAVKPDSALGRTFFLIPTGGPSVKVSAYDLTTQQLLGTEEVPGVSGSPSNLIRWGEKGLAFRTTGGQVFLVESPKLIP